MSDSSPCFSFGVLADVQYADVPNKLNFAKTRMRYYRNSPKLVREAASTWNNEHQKPRFVVHLGDLIDGFNNKKGKVNSHKALQHILAEFDYFDSPVHHVLGNHEFYNFTRKELWDTPLNTTQLDVKCNGEDVSRVHSPSIPREREELWDTPLNTTQLDVKCNGEDVSQVHNPRKREELWDTYVNNTQCDMKHNGEDLNHIHNPRGTSDNYNQTLCGCNNLFYYKFHPHPAFCFIVLDTYDVSGPAHREECPRYKEALKVLCKVNKNTGFDLNSPTGLDGTDMRYVLYNGGIGKAQLDWLRGVLAEATKLQQKVFLLGHIPISPDAACFKCLLWNYDEILETLGAFDCVVAYLCGHTHVYEYAQDANGIHHLTFPGVVEVEPGSNAFATIDVYQDCCQVRGVGKMPSFKMEYAMPRGHPKCHAQGTPECHT